MTKRIEITDKDLLRIEKSGDCLRFFFSSHSRPHLENIVTYHKGKYSCDCGAAILNGNQNCVHIKYLKRTTI